MVIVLGDAAGHGVKACMSIMTMHTLISMIRDRRFPTPPNSSPKSTAACATAT